MCTIRGEQAQSGRKADDKAAIACPANAILDKDTGFQGYEPAHVITRQKKEPKGQELSVGDR